VDASVFLGRLRLSSPPPLTSSLRPRPETAAVSPFWVFDAFRFPTSIRL